MEPDLLSFTGLPNLHPAVVHFPLALAPIAALFDIARLTVARHRLWLEPAATWLWVFAAVGAATARWTGQRAAATLTDMDLEADRVLASHADQALIATILLAVVAMARLFLSNYERDRTRPNIVWGSVVLAVGVAGLGILGSTADLGGRLVYEHGLPTGRASRSLVTLIGVPGPAAAPTTSSADGSSPEPAALPEIGERGGLRWRPHGPGSIGRGVTIESSSGPQALRPLDQPAAGLVLAVEGTGLLALPGTFADLRVDADLDLSDFVGTVAILFHRGTSADHFALTLEPGGAAVARLLRDGRPFAVAELGSLDRSNIGLSVASVGRHHKGRINGELVIHGHDSALPPGGVALSLNGRGVVRLARFEVVPGRDD